jgi:hypothetical protein
MAIYSWVDVERQGPTPCMKGSVGLEPTAAELQEGLPWFGCCLEEDCPTRASQGFVVEEDDCYTPETEEGGCVNPSTTVPCCVELEGAVGQG